MSYEDQRITPENIRTIVDAVNQKEQALSEEDRTFQRQLSKCFLEQSLERSYRRLLFSLEELKKSLEGGAQS